MILEKLQLIFLLTQHELKKKNLNLLLIKIQKNENDHYDNKILKHQSILVLMLSMNKKMSVLQRKKIQLITRAW